MDSPSSNPNPQLVDSSVSIRNDEETRSHSVDQNQSSEETIPTESPVVPQLSTHVAPMAIDNEDREFGCKYCSKRFSNRQALGGHQNAHKIERTLEKTAREAQKNGLGYFGGPSSPHFLASYPTSHDLMSGSYLSWPYPAPQHAIPTGYSSRPTVPMPVEPYRPRSVLEWSAPLPGHHQFLRYPQPYVANHGPSYRYPNAGEGSSSSVRPISEHRQGLSALTLRPEPSENLGDGNNLSQMNGPIDQEVDESGLDLTLRL